MEFLKVYLTAVYAVGITIALLYFISIFVDHLVSLISDWKFKMNYLKEERIIKNAQKRK